MVDELRFLVHGGFVLLTDYIELFKVAQVIISWFSWCIMLLCQGFSIFYLVLSIIIFLLRDHMCLLSSVTFHSLGLVKDFLWLVCTRIKVVHDIQARILPNGTIGRDYSNHTSSESLKSLDFKSN